MALTLCFKLTIFYININLVISFSFRKKNTSITHAVFVWYRFKELLQILHSTW